MSRAIVPVLLAAGSSSRFEGGHKLLSPLDRGAGPRPVVAHALAALLDGFDTRPIVVTGARGEEVEAALGAPATILHNPVHARGMGTSLAVAARAVLERHPGAAMLLALGDMPLVNAATLRAVAAALSNAPDAAARAVTAGPPPRPGHPVALGPAWLPVMAALTGDEGLRAVLAAAAVRPVPVDARTQIDVDTREALARAAAMDTATDAGTDAAIVSRTSARAR